MWVDALGASVIDGPGGREMQLRRPSQEEMRHTTTAVEVVGSDLEQPRDEAPNAGAGLSSR